MTSLQAFRDAKAAKMRPAHLLSIRHSSPYHLLWDCKILQVSAFLS
jgi:hypothetical protein